MDTTENAIQGRGLPWRWSKDIRLPVCSIPSNHLNVDFITGGRAEKDECGYRTTNIRGDKGHCDLTVSTGEMERLRGQGEKR
jgi:hypothetical protein